MIKAVLALVKKIFGLASKKSQTSHAKDTEFRENLHHKREEDTYTWDDFFNLLDKLYKNRRITEDLKPEIRKAVYFIKSEAIKREISEYDLFKSKEAYFAIINGYVFPKKIWINLSDELRKSLALKISTGEVALDKYKITYFFEEELGEKYPILITEKVVPEEIREFYKMLHNLLQALNISEERKKEIAEQIEELKQEYNFSPYIEFFKDAKLAVFPTKRQRIRGVKRLEKAWKFLLYDLQLQILQTEIGDLASSYTFNVLYAFTDEIVKGLKIRPLNPENACEICKILAETDWGYGKGVIPVEFVPLPSPHRGCRCLFTPTT